MNKSVHKIQMHPYSAFGLVTGCIINICMTIRGGTINDKSQNFKICVIGQCSNAKYIQKKL